MSIIEYIIDNKVVYDICNGGPVACSRSMKCDLYRCIFSVTIKKAIKLTVRWMPSHLKDEGVLSPGVSRGDVHGNGLADDLAGKAAERFTLPLHVTGPYLYHVSLTKKIQHRLATILINLSSRTKPNCVVKSKPAPITSPSVHELMAESQHILHSDAKRVGCVRCHSSFLLSDPAFPHWVKSRCAAIATSYDRPVSLPFEELHIGNQYTHISHQLNKFRGLIYCRKCGCRAGRALIRKLSDKCQPGLTGLAWTQLVSHGLTWSSRLV